MSNPERSGYNSQNGGAGPAYSNGPVPNPLMHSPQVSTGQGYNAAYPGSYPHSLPVKAPLHPSSSGQYTYGGLPNVSQLEHFQGPGQTLNRPQMALATTAPLPGTSSFPRMPPPPQNSVTLTAPSTGVASGAHPSPNPGWQYGAPHVNVLPVGPQTNHVAHHTGTLSSQTPLSGNTRPPTSHPYVTSSSGPPLQSNYTSPGPAPPPMSAPLGLPYQPAKPQLCPPPVGGMSLNRPSAPPTGLPSSPMPPQPQSKSAHQEGSVPAGSVNDGSLVQNSYDAIEGGGYMASTQLPPPPSQNPKMNRHVGYSYPALPPGYQNVPQSAVPGQRPVSQQQYPPGPQQYPQPSMGPNQLTSSLGGLSLQQSQQPEGLRPVNLLQERNMLPPIPLQPPVPNLHEDIQKLNCSPELFRSTLTNIPQTQTLLNKAKLPLGLLIHPFKDLSV